MENRAATAWASAQSNAATLAADLDCGDNVSYDAAEDMGEQVFRELQAALRQRDLVLVDDGDGHEVRSAVSAPDPAHDVAGNGSESHYDLARQLEARGYDVDADSEDNEHSYVRFDDEYVGDIHGDTVATVTTKGAKQ